MSDKKANLAAVSTFADHEVILPPNKLKKAVQKVLDTDVEFDPVAKAEAALAELSQDFSAWMGQECDRLDAARHAMRAGVRRRRRGSARVPAAPRERMHRRRDRRRAHCRRSGLWLRQVARA